MKRKIFSLILAAGLTTSIGVSSTLPISTSVSQQADEKMVLFTEVEKKPSFPGGDAEMYKYLATAISYPTEAAEEGVSGRVIVSFIIEKDGTITNVKVTRGKHPALDKEAVRVVSKMPKWIPGMIENKPVRVSYLLPINFHL